MPTLGEWMKTKDKPQKSTKGKTLGQWVKEKPGVLSRVTKTVKKVVGAIAKNAAAAGPSGYGGGGFNLTPEQQKAKQEWEANVVKSVGRTASGVAQGTVKFAAGAANLIPHGGVTRASLEREVNLGRKAKGKQPIARKPTPPAKTALGKVQQWGQEALIPMSPEELARMPVDMAKMVVEGVKTFPEALQTGNIDPQLNAALILAGAAKGGVDIASWAKRRMTAPERIAFPGNERGQIAARVKPPTEGEAVLAQAAENVRRQMAGEAPTGPGDVTGALTAAGKAQRQAARTPKPKAATVPKSRIVEPTPTPETGAAETTPVKVQTPSTGYNPVVRMSTQDIGVDPHTFQFRLERNTELENVKQWDPDLAGVILVWEDPATSKTWVVNGHHRLALANRLGVDQVDVRYINAKTAAEARVKGALANIAENRASAVDAAKLFRDTGLSAEDLAASGVSLTGKVASDGMALSRLNDNLFNAVIQEKISREQGTAIGRRVTDPAAQDSLYTLIQRKQKGGRTVSAKTLDEVTRRVLAAAKAEVGPTVGDQKVLFDTTRLEKNLAVEEGDLSAYIRGKLAQDKALFGRLASESVAEELKRGQNIIEPNENAKIAAQAAIIDEVYVKLSESPGGINDILREGARRLAAKENANAVKADIYRQIREEVSAFVEGREGGRARPAEITGGAEPTPTQAPEPPLTPANRQGQMTSPLLESPDDFTLVSQKAAESRVPTKEPATPEGQTTFTEPTPTPKPPPAKGAGKPPAPKAAKPEAIRAEVGDALAQAAEAKSAGKLTEAASALDDVANAALERIRQRNAGRATMGVDPFDLADITVYTAAKLGSGALKAADVAAHLAQQFGEEVGARARQVFDDAVESLRRAGHDVTGMKWIPPKKEGKTGPGISRARLEAQRTAEGLAPIEVPPFRAKDPLYAEAKTKVDGGWNIDAIAKRIMDDPGSARPEEVAGLKYRLDQVDAAISTAKTAKQRQTLADKRDTIHHAARRAGRSWGEIGQALQLTEAAEDLGNLGSVLQMAKDAKGRALTLPEIGRVTDYQKAYTDLLATYQQLQSAKKAAPAQRVVKTAADFKSDWGASNTIITRELREAARQRLLAKSARMQAGIDPTVVADLAVEIGYHIEAGARFTYKTLHQYLRDEYGANDAEIKAAYQQATNDKRLAAAKQRAAKTLAELQTGKVAAKPPKVLADRELIKLREQVADARAKLMKEIAPGFSAIKARLIVSGLLNAPTGWLAGFDDSFLGRQGLKMLTKQPRAWWKAAKASHQALRSEGMALIIDDTIMADEFYPLAERSNLFHASIEVDKPLATAEEVSMYMRAFGSIPGVGKVTRPFDRAYTTAGNVMRFEAFKRIAKAMQGKWTDADFTALADHLNKWTARGNIGRAGAFQPELNAVFISFRKMASEFQVLAEPVTSKSPAVRKMAAVDLVRYMGALAALAMFVNSAQNKFTIGLNPGDKGEFLKLRVGDTRYDLTGGQASALAAIWATGLAFYNYSRFSKNEPGPFTQTAGEVVGRYLEGRWAPGLSFGKELWTGKDFMGKPITPGQATTKLITPWNVRDIWEAWKQEGVGIGIGTALSSFYGIGAQTYPDQSEGVKAINEALKARSTPSKKVQAAKDEAIERVRAGNFTPDDVDRWIRQGVTTPEGWGRFYTEALKGDLGSKFTRLSVKDRLAVWPKLSPAEREELARWDPTKPKPTKTGAGYGSVGYGSSTGFGRSNN